MSFSLQVTENSIGAEDYVGAISSVNLRIILFRYCYTYCYTFYDKKRWIKENRNQRVNKDLLTDNLRQESQVITDRHLGVGALPPPLPDTQLPGHTHSYHPPLTRHTTPWPDTPTGQIHPPGQTHHP